MNEQRAQQLIVGCLAASTVVAAGSALADGKVPGLPLVVGLGFTGVGLATTAMFSPSLAGGFAVLVLTTTVFLYGEPFMASVSSLTAGRAAATVPTPTQPHTAPSKGIPT